MLMEESTIPNIPNEVINYVEEQHARHRELTKQKKSLKKCIKKVQGMLKMIEGRNDGLPCTIAAGNLYQQCTVEELRESTTRWHFDMRCAANANDAPIALEPGLIFCLLAMARSADIYGYNVETKLFDSASKSKSTSFHIAPVAFFVLSVRLCSLIKPLRSYPI
ncbi:GD14354 [Drosophila simulans]|uniref:GD14354 n=1 Tax=Drosophila simulans TaxID=7240 RepID=B4QQS7_DROSI|nr:GD14354 [Drosophila simulans]